jgi:GNAT superfamily N-acetyltransferase
MVAFLERATEADAGALTALRRAVAEHLTRRHGQGPWSWSASEQGVRTQVKRSAVYLVRDRDQLIATLRLASKRPWAIDAKYFTSVKRPLYLTDMAVAPDWQGRGVGRSCMNDATRAARQLEGDAIRLDAYQAKGPGAGPFYQKCGFREVGRVSFRMVPLVYYELLV